jgi:HEAT repeat protein
MFKIGNSTIWIVPAVLCYCIASDALSPPLPPELRLADAGLSNAPHDAYVMLRDGLPEGFRPKYGHEVWPIGAYEIIELLIPVAAQNPNHECAPMLARMLNADFPRQLDEALDLDVVGKSTYKIDASWEDLDAERLQRLSNVRSEAARALGDMSERAVLPELRSALDNERNRSEIDIHKYPLQNLCLLASRLNDPSGVDTMLTVLPRLQTSEQSSAEDTLESMTSHSFRNNLLNEVPPTETRISIWTSWWAKNREGFDFEAARLRAQTSSDTRAETAPMSLKGHILMASITRESRRTPPGNEWVVWMDENAPKNLKAIRSIAEDQNEENWVRGFAAEAYLHYVDQRQADHWIAKMAMIPRPCIEKSPYSVPQDPFGRMNPKKADTIERVARACLRRNGQYAVEAVAVLAKRPANADFLVEHIPAIHDPRARAAAINSLASLKYKDVQPYADALDDNDHTVQVAALTAVLNLGSTEKLATNTEARLNSLLGKPIILCALAANSYQAPIGGKKRLDWLLQARDCTTADSAMEVLINVNILYTTSYGATQTDDQADLFHKIIRGVDNWRVSRGRAPIETLL